MKKIIALVLVSMFFLVSCGKPEPENISESSVEQRKETVTIYFADENASGLVAETRDVTENTVESALEALLSGSESGVTVIGAGTRILGCRKDGITMTVDLSEEFLQSYGDTLAIYSVVNTVTEFEGISFVKITINGKDDAVLGNYILSESFTRNDSIMVESK